jgi:hypothetical protein
LNSIGLPDIGAMRAQLGVRRAERQDEIQRTEALKVVRVGDREAQNLAEQAAEVVGNRERQFPRDAPQDVIDEWIRQDRRRRDEALQTFKLALLEREVDAYLKGVETTTDRANKRAVNMRSIVLLLVVLAVVAMPLYAIWRGLSPQDFGSYMAPVTGITGTVVGYWFGAGDRARTGPGP